MSLKIKFLVGIGSSRLLVTSSVFMIVHHFTENFN